MATAAAKTVNVANAAQLTAALAAAKGGETILLAAGDYGALTIKSRAMTSTVTIKSADPAHAATITDLRVVSSSNLRFEGIDLHRPLAAGEADFTQAAYISSSSNVAIVGMHFTGSMDGNASNDGTGLRITGSNGIQITGSSLEQWSNAVILADNTAVTVSGNTVSNVVHSFNLSGLQDGSFTGNYFVNAKADWATGATAGKNLVFADNSVTASAASAAAAAATATGAGKTIAVSTAAQLTAAIAAVKGGETIVLAPGNYGTLNITHRNVADTVTIKSADYAHDAVFANIRVADATNFTFSHVDVHRPLTPGEADFTQAVYVSGSSHIGFVDMAFTGSMDNNAWNDGVALRISSSTDVKLLDSTFEQWNNAVVFDRDTGLVVAGNTVTAVREGFDFAAVHNVTIAQNLFKAFQPNYVLGDHSDSLQFWNTGVNEGSSHVTISDNVILQGANYGSQGIFIRAEDPLYRHSDFTITNNLYNGDARHGITVAGVDGAVVSGNTVTSAPGGMLEAGINISNASNVLVEKNVAPLLLEATSTGIVWRDNVDLWDTAVKKGVALNTIFTGTATGGDIAAYAVKAGSTAAGLHAGFAMLDGIGAAAFDAAHLGHLSGLAPLLA